VVVVGLLGGFGGNPLDATWLRGVPSGLSEFCALHPCHALWGWQQTKSKKSSVEILGGLFWMKKNTYENVKSDMTKKNEAT
jgi:hypothetical protein